MLGEPEDVQTLIAAGTFCRRLLKTKSLGSFVVEETAPTVKVQTEDDWANYIRETAATSYHHSGTCKMGLDSMAVVDPNLKVHGIERLRVVDGSIMPTITSGNTNAACMMIGEKGSQLILQDRS